MKNTNKYRTLSYVWSKRDWFMIIFVAVAFGVMLYWFFFGTLFSGGPQG